MGLDLLGGGLECFVRSDCKMTPVMAGGMGPGVADSWNRVHGRVRGNRYGLVRGKSDLQMEWGESGELEGEWGERGKSEGMQSKLGGVWGMSEGVRGTPEGVQGALEGVQGKLEGVWENNCLRLAGTTQLVDGTDMGFVNT